MLNYRGYYTIHSYPFTSIHHAFGECYRVFDPSYPICVWQFWQDMKHYTTKANMEHLRVVGTSFVHARSKCQNQLVCSRIYSSLHPNILRLTVASGLLPIVFWWCFLVLWKGDFIGQRLCVQVNTSVSGTPPHPNPTIIDLSLGSGLHHPCMVNWGMSFVLFFICVTT